LALDNNHAIVWHRTGEPDVRSRKRNRGKTAMSDAVIGPPEERHRLGGVP
jgi:hypothetical protein